MRASLPDAASESYSTGMDKGRWVCGYEGCQSEGSSMVVLSCAGSAGCASLLSLFERGQPSWSGGFAIGRRIGGDGDQRRHRFCRMRDQDQGFEERAECGCSCMSLKGWARTESCRRKWTGCAMRTKVVEARKV
jgi:hypothetical protein